MHFFEIKTHRVGMTYDQPHFFILNKGLNSGKPLYNPCPNCFVVTTTTEEDKNTLFHLSIMLQIGGFFAYYLKGSVIPFIGINDCSKTLKHGLSLSAEVVKHIQIIKTLNQEQIRLTQMLSKIDQLKQAYIQSCFSQKKNEINT
ncbi:DUF6943 family protein [Wenyingzhuangia marina]|uniref:Type I restriction modification DNA specificity domain-containing protein n=1 Tax=Wenyingzhuangia marina TaxID=1195760 RepID=A0A1M5S6U7_9FLAO|nr:hypothetical protein [Wenyingzhuangia marina]SHH34008.1 hypothetical protein SAMN05444281_0147 [Wenyingzhuangia marina]